MKKQKYGSDSETDVSDLAYELTYHRYLLSKGKVKDLFTELPVAEYIALVNIARNTPKESIRTHKTYLKELAERMELSIHSISKMVSKLKEKGLVLWSHDGNGSEGTYIVITETGLNALHTQEKILKNYYQEVIERVGRDRLVHIIEELQTLKSVMEYIDAGGSDIERNETE